MTDTSGAQPSDDSVPPVPAAPAAPLVPPAPRIAGNGASYDSAPYTPPPAPQYDTGAYAGYPEASAPPAYAPPAYTPPTYPTSPYGAAPTSPYGAAPAAAPAPYGGQYGAPAAAPYGYGAYAPPRRTNGMAIASFICSLGGVLLSWTGVLALALIGGVVFGHISLGQIKRTGEAGRGLALAGVLIGWISIGIAVLLIVFAMLFWGLYGFGVTRSRYGA